VQQGGDEDGAQAGAAGSSLAPGFEGAVQAADCVEHLGPVRVGLGAVELEWVSGFERCWVAVGRQRW